MPAQRSALAEFLVQRMTELGMNPKQVSRDAGLGDTYARDIIEGRSADPRAGKLQKIARVLKVEAATLLALAAAPPGAKVVSDPLSLLLLEAFGDLSDEDKKLALDQIEGLLSHRKRMAM